MAEIPIQRKERHTWWMWLLLLIVVLAAAWYFWVRTAAPVGTANADSTATLMPARPDSTMAADSAAANRAATPARPDSAAARP